MKKSKIIVPAVALLALGMAASVTGTVAWYSVQANATVSNSASINAPSNLIEIGLWSPFGASHAPTNEEKTGTASKALNDATVLTDVHSDDAVLVQKKDIGASGSIEGDYYDVSDNPTFTAAATNTEYAADATTGGSASKVGVKNNSKAFMRFGFYIKALQACTVTVNTKTFTVTHNDDDESAAMYAFVGEAATVSNTGGSATCTKAQLPSGSTNKSVEDTPDTQAVSVELNLANPGSMLKDAYKYYVATVWAEGTAFATNDKLDQATTALNIVFGAVAA